MSRLGEKPQTANFELARYELTPRALRGLQISVDAALKAYAQSTGAEIPSIAQFEARAAMPSLENLIQAPKPPAQNEP